MVCQICIRLFWAFKLTSFQPQGHRGCQGPPMCLVDSSTNTHNPYEFEDIEGNAEDVQRL